MTSMTQLTNAYFSMHPFPPMSYTRGLTWFTRPLACPTGPPSWLSPSPCAVHCSRWRSAPCAIRVRIVHEWVCSQWWCILVHESGVAAVFSCGSVPWQLCQSVLKEMIIWQPSFIICWWTSVSVRFRASHLTILMLVFLFCCFLSSNTTARMAVMKPELEIVMSRMKVSACFISRNNSWLVFSWFPFSYACF